jgi:hypothetical protein
VSTLADQVGACTTVLQPPHALIEAHVLAAERAGALAGTDHIGSVLEPCETQVLRAGSERGADRAAVMASLIMTAKLNNIDPLAWLADVLRRIADLPQSRLPELLPWHWAAQAEHRKVAA